MASTPQKYDRQSVINILRILSDDRKLEQERKIEFIGLHIALNNSIEWKHVNEQHLIAIRSRW